MEMGGGGRGGGGRGGGGRGGEVHVYLRKLGERRARQKIGLY